jgi:hypothetical protein
MTAIDASPAGLQNDRDHDGDGEDAHALGQRAGDQKDAGSDLSHVRPEAPLHEFVGGEHLALEIARQENGRNHHPGQQISENHLEKNVAPAVGQRRRADNGQRAGFRRNDGERDGPPRRGLAAQKVVFERTCWLCLNLAPNHVTPAR